ARRSREAPEIGAQLCRSEAVARAVAKFEGSREETGRGGAMKGPLRPRREAVCFGRTWGGVVSAFSWVFFAVASVLLVPSSSADEPAGGPVVLELKLDGEVEPILATYIHEGLQDRSEEHTSELQSLAYLVCRL